MALHISAHQRTVSVVVFEEGDKSGSDRDDLLRANVHEVNIASVNLGGMLAKASSNAVVNKAVVLVKRLISLSNDKLFFFVSSHVNDLVGDTIINNAAIRSLDESEAIDASIVRKGADKTDIGTFRRFDRAHATVMRVMNIADFEAGTFTR